jgi:hypothetical protein
MIKASRKRFSLVVQPLAGLIERGVDDAPELRYACSGLCKLDAFGVICYSIIKFASAQS